MTGIFGSTVLDTAIGIVFVYLLVSLLASVINEWIARAASLRATTLEDGVRQMLHDPPNGGFTDQVFSHPLISGLSPIRPGKTTRVQAPSYIPSREFALALIDVIAPQGGGTSQSIQDLRISVGRIQNETVKNALQTIINDAENDITNVRSGIERWFNDVMDRVSGWYRRKLQIISISVGLVLVALLNVDTIAVTQSLWSTPDVRQSMVSAATDYVKSNVGTGESFSTQANSAEKALVALPADRLPIFWSTQSQDPRAFPWINPSLDGWASKIVGILISAVAVSLGAPFWFDVLSRFVNVRSSGPAPAVTTKQQAT